MDTRAHIDIPPRPFAREDLAGQPLVSLAWRFLRDDHRRRREERDRQERSLAALADATHALSLAEVAFRQGSQGSPSGQCRALSTVVARMTEALSDLGVRLVAPQGTAYTAELRELLQSVSQLPTAGLGEPLVEETIEPAILIRDRLLRMGKAVIRVPAGDGETSTGVETGPPDSEPVE